MSILSDTILNDIRTFLLDPDNTVCVSGGASGADAMWSIIAAKHGIDTIHYSYHGHKKYSKDAVGLQVEISQEKLKDADISLKKANKTVGRNFPCRSLDTNSLLRRNYYQVLDSTSCYAVSRISYGKVEGGTAWATQMFIDKHMETKPYDECLCFVYDTITNQWFQWVFNSFQQVGANDVPTPKGIWTGIGSRDLTQEAIQAMEALWPQSHQTM